MNDGRKKLWRWVLAGVAVCAPAAAQPGGVAVELTEQISRAVPPNVTLDRFVSTPHHVVLSGHTSSLDGVTDLLESLAQVPGIQEPELRRADRGEHGYELTVVVPTSKAVPEAAVHPADPASNRPPFATHAIKQRLERWLFPPFVFALSERSGRSGGKNAPWEPPQDFRAAAGSPRLAELSIDEIAVREIFATSVGNIAHVRARQRDFLIRAGDQLADGDVDGIYFSAPTIAWLRFRRRVLATPGVPYRPVVWVLAGDALRPNPLEPRLRRLDAPPDLAVGRRWTRRFEALVLAARPSGPGAFPPWGWQLTVKAASGSRAKPVLELVHRISTPWWGGQQRPAGIAGLLIDEIEVRGLFMTPAGRLAEVRSIQGTFFLSEGDQLWDGDVVGLDLAGDVIFKQTIDDPTALKPFREVVKSAAPFGASSPLPAARYGEPASSRPSALTQLSCYEVAAVERDLLSDVLERADQRLLGYLRERWLAETHLSDAEGTETRRFLADVEQAVSSDLAALFGTELPRLKSILEVLEPSPTEMLALLGDLRLIAGRLSGAAAAYRLAERLSPAYAPLCGRLWDGKLYGAESYFRNGPDNAPREAGLTGYLLAWDPGSGRVLERHLLPQPPAALMTGRGALQIAIHGSEVRLGESRLEPETQVSASISMRLASIRNGVLLAGNFVDFDLKRASGPFVVRRQIDDRLPVTPVELETALRAAAVRDPTQPWHRFLLGQALWAQDRREEAEAVWWEIRRGGPQAFPFYETAWMAVFHEMYGQTAWADRVFDLALAERRRLPRPIAACDPVDRWVNVGAFWLDGRLQHDPDRRYLWWRRVREISGMASGDAFRSTLWVAELTRRGDRQAAREELAFLERARENGFDLTTRSAWLDYSLYLVVAVAAMLYACLAVQVGRMAQHLRTHRPRWPGWKTLGLGAVRGPGRRRLALVLALVLALHVALSLAILAASYLGFLMSASFDWSDMGVTAKGSPPQPEPHELTRTELLRAWLTRGIVKPATGPPGPLVEAMQAIQGHGLGSRVLLAGATTGAMLVLALPVGLLLTWRRARDVVARWVPGALHTREGAELRGIVVFGLFVFAVVPLSWLVVAKTWGPVPAPGLVSANFFPNADVLEPLLPLPPPAADDPAAGRGDFERLCAASFWRLLAVYSGAELFWPLVVCALVVALSFHARRLGSARRR